MKPYYTGMKITMNIDDSLLESVMKATGIKSKTGAVDHVLREWDRRNKLRSLLENNLGLSESDLIHAFDDNYDVLSSRIAEDPVTYGKRTRPD
jgi:Arc/MetJ family transcription regulator